MPSLPRTARVETIDAVQARSRGLAFGGALILVAVLAASYPFWERLGAPTTLLVAGPFAFVITTVLLVHAYVRGTRPRVVAGVVARVDRGALVIERGDDETKFAADELEAIWLEDREAVVVTRGERVVRVRTGSPQDAASLAKEMRATSKGPTSSRVPLDVLDTRGSERPLYAMAAIAFVIGGLWNTSLRANPQPLLEALVPLAIAAIGMILVRRSRPVVLTLGREGFAEEGRAPKPYRRIANARADLETLVVTTDDGEETALDVGRPTSAEALAAELTERARPSFA
ncbi:MAG: hypothetical protein HOW73_32370 [Polyangiaceae bacterium]|nr:hypothetical protein [Polyangiaceae bacterium]